MSAPLAPAPAYGTPDWLEWRRGGLGASELAAVLGLDPHRTERDVWLLKTGRAEPFAGNPRTRWGHRMERVGLDAWAELTGGHPPEPNDEPFQDPRWPHLWATPDGIERVTAARVGIEVKLTSAWETPPERVRVQCLAGMGIAGLARMDVVRLSFDSDPAVFRVERDEAAIEDVLAAGEAWYALHVIGGVEPPGRPDEAEADDRQAALAADLRRVRSAMAALEARERAIRDDLIASVAGRGVITGAGFRVEVRAGHEVTRTGWREAATELMDGMAEGEREALLSRHRTTSRVRPAVHATWDEEEG